MEKKWTVLDENPKDLRRTLLKNRKIEDPDSFFKPHLYKLTSPGKLFPELEKAISRIKKAIKNKELVYIYGDFDVDGITGTAILWETINFLGGKVLPYIPHREKEGYGIHSEAIEKLAKTSAKVIVSVDCGITAVEEAKIAKNLGIDLIITDHHSIQPELPRAFALLHTDKLAGSGVAFMLAKALLESFNEGAEQLFKNLELAAIGTIADMVPVTADNRIIIANGLHNLTHTKRLGLKALYDEASISKKIGTTEVGFMISPRLNAMGRMESALDSLRLLLTNKEERAQQLANKLSKVNKERQEATSTSLDHARKSAEENGSTKIIVTHHSSYLPGVIGLVAGRLVDEFYKPAIAISESEPLSKGSARSIQSFNITEAIGSHKKLLQSFGGHPMAAGFSIVPEKILQFKEKVINHAEKNINSEDLTPVLKIDTKLDVNSINRDSLELTKEFEPFGIGNPDPVFMSEKLEVSDLRTVGGGKHLRMVLRGPNYKVFSCIGFGLGGKQINIGDRVDIAYNLKEDNWRGDHRLELNLKDVRSVG